LYYFYRHLLGSLDGLFHFPLALPDSRLSFFKLPPIRVYHTKISVSKQVNKSW
jgi:hypothetical protein